jgi:hypothetical protein
MLIGVVAHVNREHLVTKLIREIDVDVIRWDDGIPSVAGCANNHIRVLQELNRCAGQRDEWCVVLEDDARPAPKFREQLEKALAVAETPLVGLYLGTGNPRGHTQQAISAAVYSAETTGSHWITADWFMSTVGYAVKTSWLAALTSGLLSRGGPADNRINDWSHQVKFRTWYTQPSLVDHADEPSMINGAHLALGDMVKPRQAWRFGTRDEWFARTVEMGYAKGWSPNV